MFFGRLHPLVCFSIQSGYENVHLPTQDPVVQKPIRTLYKKLKRIKDHTFFYYVEMRK